MVRRGWQVSAKEIANPVVPNAQIRGFTHGQYPSLGNKTHVGVDLAAPCGTPVFSFADGEVIDVVASKRDDQRRFEALGYMVLIEHPVSLIGKAFYTLYLHFQSAPSVVKGDKVQANQSLGVVGDTGKNTTGCHTHFEVRFFPQLYFPPWAGIYGDGDQRQSLYFKLGWADPVGVFMAFPGGIPSAAYSLPSPTRTARDRPPSTLSTEVTAAIRYHGIYSHESKKDCIDYLRFHDDGAVIKICVAKGGTLWNIVKWFNREHNGVLRGRYVTNGNKIQFDIKGRSTWSYSGIIKGTVLYLDWYKHNSKSRGRRARYEFVAFSAIEKQRLEFDRQRLKTVEEDKKREATLAEDRAKICFPGYSKGQYVRVRTKNPSEDAAQRVLRINIFCQSDGLIELVSFTKRYAQSREMRGVKIYILYYEAEIRFVRDSWWRRPGISGRITFYTDKRDEGSNPTGKKMVAGDSRKIRGKIVFEKIEKGWWGQLN